ncbi:cytochrome P450 [Artomyces pyxidatus]|uniref:Cytochrome P450 n=1 Tax=Artomyces pyxidatus TaxID=48021 RepID=A0ACB8STB0_9AGAM|nr:cytochrome P450 [Artomyces pyxidatus]
MFPGRLPSLLNVVQLTAIITSSLAIAFALFSLIRHRIRQMVLWQLPGPPSPSILVGNLNQMFDPAAGLRFRDEVRKKYGSVSRFNGILGDQMLLISDPKALAAILVKSQDSFQRDEWFIELFRHSIGPGLFSSSGALHRRQRKVLNPIFSTQQMRALAPLLQTITSQLRDALHARLAAGQGPQELEMVDWFGRLGLEMIAQGGLGHTFDSFAPRAPANAFKTAVEDFLPLVARLQTLLPLFPLVSGWPPALLRRSAALLPLPDVQRFVDISETLCGAARRLFEEKKARMERGEEDAVSGGRDIVSVLMKANASAKAEHKIEDDEVMSHMLTLLGAATETSSAALARMAHVLAEHQDAQDRLRAELNAAGADELANDQLMELPYLDAICRETLRLCAPPLSSEGDRSCADVTVPLSRPIDGPAGLQSAFVIPRDTIVMVDILSANCDPHIWGPDADVWRPERWLAPLPDSVADAHMPGVYSNMLTFLGGGTSCIGFKLSELEIKIALSQLVRAFRFLPSKTEIVWRVGIVTTPSVKGSTTITPEMPMMVERI